MITVDSLPKKLEPSGVGFGAPVPEEMSAFLRKMADEIDATRLSVNTVKLITSLCLTDFTSKSLIIRFHEFPGGLRPHAEAD